jgi:hypothetical protein
MIEEGKSLSEICELDFMPNKTTILRWSVADNKVEFGLKYARAYRVRILAQIEERDELALMEISALSCDEIAVHFKFFFCWLLWNLPRSESGVKHLQQLPNRPAQVFQSHPSICLP